MNQNPVEEGQKFPLTIRRMGINGEGIGYFKKAVVFVPGAITGEEVVVEAVKVRDRFTEAKLNKIRKKSPNRVIAPCPVYEACGGCQLQHVAYSAQLELKRDIVIQSIEKHTKIDPAKLKIRPTIGMEDPWRYRNKSQFQTRMVGSGQVETGLFGANSHQLVPIEDCIVQQPVTIKVTNFVRDLLEKYAVPIYDEKAGSGIVRTIVVRTGVKTGETQLVFITNSKKLPKKREMLAEIEAALPEVTSIMQNVNQAKSSLIFGDETFLLAGKESIEEKLMELEFDLSARAFFQLNPFQTERLYQEVEKALVLTGSETLVDAYCGVGTIGQAFAGKVKEVRGMDIIPESIEDAKRNAEKNGIENVYYEVGKAEDVLPKWVKEGFRPDAVIVDPPRSGCDQGLIKSLLEVEAKQLVYVSCNPSTLARDLALLAKKYRIRYMQPVDMFPQTAHVETVVLLSKLKSTKPIDVEINLDDMDLTKSESKATYAEIKQYVLDNAEFKVSQLYIAQVKRKHGIIERINYNIGVGKTKIPQVPLNKEKAIEDALRHFRMID